MALRPFSREQVWLLPPALGDLILAEHPARFIAAFVDGLEQGIWKEMEIDLDGEGVGAPAYDPRVLLSVWLYGFVTGVRSVRKLEAACREQVPYMWLTGCQAPDHNTLWRFYKANRQGMRQLFRRTVKTAVRLGLVDLAVQAVDGSKVAGSAARERTYDEAGLRRLLERMEVTIRELEAQNGASKEPSLPRLPAELAKAHRLREQVRKALEEVREEEGAKRVNLTDGDAQWVKGRGGVVAGYNAQAVVSPLKADAAGRSGLIITAADVVSDADDHGQLVPMVAKAQETTGRVAGVTLADGGYHCGPTLVECEEQKIKVLMPEGHNKPGVKHPYHKDNFGYDQESDIYTCPQGQRLGFVGVKKGQGRPLVRVYGASAKVCRACPAFGKCTKDKRRGRALQVGPYEAELRRHSALMTTEEAKIAYRRRKELVEPAFGILKEQHGARRFLLRGLPNVVSEWILLGTAFNLRTLWRVWRGWYPEKRAMLTGKAAA